MSKQKLEALADEIEGKLISLPINEYHEVLRILGYRHPWRPRRTGWTNVLDQVLHAIYAIIIFLPILLLTSWVGTVISGLLVGIIREWEQWKNHDYKILMLKDRAQDALFFGVGAAAVYLMVSLFRG